MPLESSWNFISENVAEAGWTCFPRTKPSESGISGRLMSADKPSQGEDGSWIRKMVSAQTKKTNTLVKKSNNSFQRLVITID